MAKQLTRATVDELFKILERLKQGSTKVVYTYIGPDGRSETLTFGIDTVAFGRRSEGKEVYIGVGYDLFVSFKIGNQNPRKQQANIVMFEVQKKVLSITVTVKHEVFTRTFSFQ